MENKLYFGVDNGVTGTIGAIYNNETWFFETPVIKEQNYTKTKGNISRINFSELRNKLSSIIVECNPTSTICLVERPMLNPRRWAASVSAARALEATLIVIEELGIPFQYEDSKKWQKKLLPIGIKGSAELKKASKEIGCRLFPQHKELIVKHKDADGILMAEYARRIF